MAVENCSEKAHKDLGTESPHATLKAPQNLDQGYQNALKALVHLREAGYQARLAGGCVRDRWLGLTPKDYDIATNAKPDEICSVFEQKNLKTIPTGIDHGTITVLMYGQALEVTTLRRDVETDGRRARVVFGSSFQEDAARRDFTMNAMFEDESLGIYDYYGGIEDLKKGSLRFVGDPKQRIAEDYLRILRCFRFWARFGFAPDDQTLAAMGDLKDGLSQLSQERVCSEYLQILAEAEVVPVVQAMSSLGILGLAFPHTPEHIVRLAAYKSITKAERAMGRMAALLIRNLKDRDLLLFLQAFRLSSRQVHQILTLVEDPQAFGDQAEAMAVLDRWEKTWGSNLDAGLAMWALLFPQSNIPIALAELEERKGWLRKRAMPLKGGDLQKSLGISPGPELGNLMASLLQAYRNQVWESEETGMQLAKNFWQNRPK